MPRILRTGARERGFTLIELLVVVVIIGILAGIAIPVFMNQKARAHEAGVKAQVNNVAKVIETLFTEQEGAIEGTSTTGEVAFTSGTVKQSVQTTVGVGWAVKGGSTGYCIAAWSAKGGKYTATAPLIYDSAVGGVRTTGSCAGGDPDTTGVTVSGDITPPPPPLPPTAPPLAPTLAALLTGTVADLSWTAPSTATSYELTRRVTTVTGGQVSSAVNGIDVAPDGTVYFTDGNYIRKVSPQGAISTLAGASGTGATEGAGSAARFYSPRGLDVGPDGNIYVADYSNYRVRKVTPDGVVSSVFSTAAQPTDVAVAPNGIIYATAGNQVWRFTGGTLSSVAGSSTTGNADGSNASASFQYPDGIAVGPDGNLYVTSYNRLRKVTPSGTVTTLASPGVALYGIDVAPDGSIYVTAGNVLYAYTSAGVQSMITNALSTPKYPAVAADGRVLIPEQGSRRLAKVDPATGVRQNFAGNGISGVVDSVVTTTSAVIYTGPNTAFSNSALSTGAFYEYTVKAINEIGSSPASTPQTVSP